MLSAVQQLLDALSALGVTLQLINTAKQLEPTSRTTLPHHQPLHHQRHITSHVADTVCSISSIGSTGKQGVMSSPVAAAGGSNAPQANADGGSSLGSSTADREYVQWQQQMLFDELASPIHGSLCCLLQQLQQLACLVVTQVRQPSAANRQQLRDKVREDCCFTAAALLLLLGWWPGVDQGIGRMVGCAPALRTCSSGRTVYTVLPLTSDTGQQMCQLLC